MPRLSGYMASRGVRPSDRILSDLAGDTGRGHILHQKLTANRERNWLLALTLHACSKLRVGLALSACERVIIDALRESGLGRARLEEHGRLYTEMNRAVREAFFPQRFAALDVDTDVGFRDLDAWLPRIQKEMLAKENALVLDAGLLLDGTISIASLPPIPPEVLAAFAGGVTVAGDPERRTRPKMKCIVRADWFKCNDGAGCGLAGADEPYWLFAAVSSTGKHPVTSRSRVFGDADTGEPRTFASHEGRVWGPDGHALELPPNLAVLVSLWEHVGGSPEDIDAVTEGVLHGTSRYLYALRNTAAPAAIVAGAGSLIVWLLTFLNEDFIADHTLILGRRVLETAVQVAGDQFRFRERFTDGDGDYTLELDVMRSPWITDGKET